MKMKKPLPIIIFLSIFIISCQKHNYEEIYDQELLMISDCKNMKMVNWILLNETGLEIDQKIEIITTDYYGGIPLKIENFPIYYKVQINENQYIEYKNKLLTGNYSDSWRFYEDNNEIHFVKFNKFELACRINKNVILFGFRNVEGIFP